MSDISAVNPYASAATPSSAAAGMGDALGADVFLQLLVAQLKYQDPTSPAEGTEFLAQTAQFTMVEKLTQIAEATEAAAIRDRNMAAATMVGRSVTWLQNDGTTGEGVVSSARLGSSGPVLIVAGKEVAFDAVSSVNDRIPTIAADPVPTSPSQTTDASLATSATDGTPDTATVS